MVDQDQYPTSPAINARAMALLQTIVAGGLMGLD